MRRGGEERKIIKMGQGRHRDINYTGEKKLGVRRLRRLEVGISTTDSEEGRADDGVAEVETVCADYVAT